jgi:peroxiredoxin
MPLTPTKAVPETELQVLGGQPFRISAAKPDTFTMLVFYRGFHCPICKSWLGDLDKRLSDFSGLGVDVVAASCDDETRALKARSDWNLQNLPIAYGLGIPAARQWGLYISRSIKDSEPAAFAEPGVFLVRPDRTLYAAIVATMPFARPHFDEILSAVRFIKEMGYPPRGDAT